MSYDKLDIAIVGDSQTWGAQLIANIKTCFTELEVNFHQDIERHCNDLKTSLETKFMNIITKVEEATVTANKALSLAELNAKRLNDLKTENVYLRNKLNSMDNFNRRNHLIVCGAKYTREENDTQCTQLVKDFFVEQLNIEQTVV